MDPISGTVWWIAGAVALAAVVALTRRGKQDPPEALPSDAEAGETAPTSAGAVEPAASSLKSGLDRTRSEGFVARLSALLTGEKLEPAVLAEVEEILFTADIGVQTATALFERIQSELSGRELADVDRVWAAVREEALAILERGEAAHPRGIAEELDATKQGAPNPRGAA